MALQIKLDQTKSFLANVPEEHVFKCCDGRTLRNMQELRDCLHSMTDETFVYHVNNQKNDFSNWVKEIIGDEKLAAYLKKLPTKTQAEIMVLARVAFLSNLAG